MTAVAKIQELLGGDTVTGRLASELDVVRLVRKGLPPAESDRLVRMARLVAAAEETIGDRDRAMIWLERPNRALEGETPLSLADTDLGAQGVERLLGQIAHGLAA